MADSIKISALPAVTTPLSTDYFAVVQGGVTKRETAEQLFTNPNIPTTSSSSVGVIRQNGTRLIHSWGTNNLFIGSGAGNFTFAGAPSVGMLGVGAGTLASKTVGGYETAIGYHALNLCTSSDQNTALGALAGSFLLTGVRNILIGVSAGGFYTGAESDNILIGNFGVLGESHICRIGKPLADGAGISDTYLYGIVRAESDFVGTIGATTPAAATFTTCTINNSLNFPTTSSSTVGVINQNGTQLIHSFGSNNLFFGSDAGNFTLSGNTNLAIGGGGVLASLTSGGSNVCVGYLSGIQIQSGTNNTVIGVGALSELNTGSGNIAIGLSAGTAYKNAESSNIVIGNNGVEGESNTCRIGVTGSGFGQQADSYIAGRVRCGTDFVGTIGATTPAAGSFTTVSATTPITGANGGTGVNNGSNTMTFAGNVNFAGAFARTNTITEAVSDGYAHGTMSSIANAETTAIQLLAAPGSNLAYIIHRIVIEIKNGSTPWSGVGNAWLVYGTTGNDQVNLASAFITNTIAGGTANTKYFASTAGCIGADWLGNGFGTITRVTATAMNNAPVSFTISNAVSAGNGTIDWKIWYSIISVT